MVSAGEELSLIMIEGPGRHVPVPAKASLGTFRSSYQYTLSHQRSRFPNQPNQECRKVHHGDSVDRGVIGGGSEWNLKG